MSTCVFSQTSDSKAFLEHGGRTLTVITKWPKLMTDTNFLHKHWNTTYTGADKGTHTNNSPKFSEFHPKIKAFQKIYCQMKTTKEEDIWSHSHISLPF